MSVRLKGRGKWGIREIDFEIATPRCHLSQPCDDNMLCERCQGFDIQAFGRDPYPYRGVPLLSVVRSANGCSFCSLLLESLQKANTNVAIKGLVVAYQGFRQAFSRNWLTLETIQLLRCCCRVPATLLEDDWVNFEAIKATEKSLAGSDGLNVASIDAFIGSVDRRGPRDSRYVQFHVAADQGEISSS